MVDQIVNLIASLEHHSYGESVDMLAHSLQSAAHASADGASNALVLAALLHDIGHVLGDAGDWGLPDHALAGAEYLERWFTADIVEPVRLHVDAKRYLVATDPTYLDQLSRASIESLALQGGPFSNEEAERFAANPHALAALSLRRIDDHGKHRDAATPALGEYRPLFAQALSSAGGSTAMISAMWAREACRCNECRDPGNGQHLIDSTDLTGWAVTGSEWSPDSLVVQLRNADGREHRSIINTATATGLPSTRWGSGHEQLVARRAVDQSKGLDGFVADLSEFGIALASGVRCEPGALLHFASNIGFVRGTNYGALFDVKSETNPVNLAYTPKGLPLHTDNPYRDPVPTVQLLHCIRPADEGGGSMFCDGFNAAEQLRDQQPLDFEILTSTPAQFRFTTDEEDLRASVPVIELDSAGEVKRVTINNRSMEPQPCSSDVDAFYRAYARFAVLLAAPENVIELTLKAGEVVGFDNRRVLHGRRGFSSDPNRHLQGCYVDIDAVHSTARLLMS